MPYNPRNTTEILRSLRASLIGRTDLTDLNRSSALTILLSAVAQEMASIERKLFTFRESFFLNGATGVELEERVAQLPPIGITRIRSTNASSSSLRIDRDPTDTSEALLIPAGSTVSDGRGTTYRTSEAVIMAVGESYVDNVHIMATAPGIAGNNSIGAINTIITMPSGVTSVINEQPLLNGTDTETDSQLRDRARIYMKGLTRTARSVLEFLGTSFVSTSGERYTYAKVYEDPTTPGYCELVVDDGSGLNIAAVSKPASTAITNITASGQQVAYHDAPATAPILPENFVVWRGGDPTQQISVGPYDYTSFPERGIVYFNQDVVQPGDRVFIQNYRVFSGFIAELQREIEGDSSNFDRLTGFRAAGTRIRVRPVEPEFISMDLSLLPRLGVNYRVLEQLVLAGAERYINSLAPGQTLYISKLIEALSSISGVRDIRILESGTTQFANNINPSSPRSVLRVRRGGINISSASA